MNKTTEQIKALLDSGFKEAQIKTILDVTDDDILVAMGVEDVKDEPVEEEESVEVPVETYDAKKKKHRGALPKFTEEDFNEMKRLKAKGLKISEIAERLGFSESYIAAVSARETYNEVLEFRARQAELKRASANKKRDQLKELRKFKEQAEKTQVVMSEPKEEYVDPKLVEFRSMADSLARIAEAFEEIAARPKKRGFFRK